MINQIKKKMKMENRSHRSDTERPRCRHGYEKYNKCLSMMVLVCIKQHLSDIWSLVHEKVKQHWVWVKKSVAYKKSVYLTNHLAKFLQDKIKP